MSTQQLNTGVKPLLSNSFTVAFTAECNIIPSLEFRREMGEGK